MKITSLQVGPIMTNCYLLCDETAKVCALIDPGDDAPQVERMVAPWTSASTRTATSSPVWAMPATAFSAPSNTSYAGRPRFRGRFCLYSAAGIPVTGKFRRFDCLTVAAQCGILFTIFDFIRKGAVSCALSIWKTSRTP